MLPVLLLAAQAGTAEPFLRYPDVHGDQVVFSCEGDIWLGSLSSGQATRLTRHPGREGYPKFSPDGKTIAFSGEYDGFLEVYTVPVSGGAPKRITYMCSVAHALGWNSDGSRILFRGLSLPKPYGLYSAPAAGGPWSKLPIEFAAHGVMDPKGNRIAFTRFNRWATAWFHYQGGMQNQIWIGDLASNQFKRITNVPGTNEFPVWEGDSVYFANEQNGKFTVYGSPASGGGPKRVAGPYDFEVREISSGPGAIIYEKGWQVEMVDLASGKTRPVRFQLNSDLIHTRPYAVPADRHAMYYSMSPSGKRVYVETRGQIASLPAGEGEARLWKAVPGARLRRPTISPDGKTMAYFSDQTGEMQLWLSDADGSNARQLTNGKNRQLNTITWTPDSSKIAYYDSDWRLRLLDLKTNQETEITHSGGAGAGNGWFGIPHSFSPDSKYLAYPIYDGVTDFGQIAVRSLETGEVKMLGTGFTNDDFPTFSRDGKYLAFLSARSFQVTDDPIQNQLNSGPVIVPCLYMLHKDVENPLRGKDTDEGAAPKKEEGKPAFKPIDFDRIEERLIVLPIAAGTYRQIAVVGNRVLLGGTGSVTFYDLAAKSGGTVAPGSGFTVSHDGTKLLIDNRVVDVNAKDLGPTVGQVGFANLKLAIDPVAEWKQIYWDAWRLLRDYFYVANMHGLDWMSIGRKYEAFLPSVRSRDELDHLLRWMQSELGSSHQYRQGGDEQALTRFETPAFLGIDVEADRSAKKLRISKIMRGDGLSPSERAPILEPGFDVREGDYLLAVAGVELNDASSYLAPLAGRAGQLVSVTVSSKPDGSDRRTAYVKPVTSENRMRLLEWVAENRRYVDKASGGKIGYLYLQAMGAGDVSDFIRQYFPQRHKQALIVDTRFNNGGYVQTVINKILEQKLSGHFNMRSRPSPWTRQWDYFAGPMACLINEFNVSCGEEFPDRFRGLKIGPLIGRRTYGGEIGSSPGWPLVDGGVISVPNYGMFTPDGKWVIEGPGVSPDIDIESDPNAFAKGVDPQMDKAIEVLMDQIRRKPTTWPMPPPDPQRIKGSGG
jgi:tricorn protease